MHPEMSIGIWFDVTHHHTASPGSGLAEPWAWAVGHSKRVEVMGFGSLAQTTEPVNLCHLIFCDKLGCADLL